MKGAIVLIFRAQSCDSKAAEAECFCVCLSELFTLVKCSIVRPHCKAKLRARF